MILADKIIEERKKNGWSQEELASKLGVSRQAVSKWESSGSIPDLQRILQMSELFGVTTDYLLKDEIEEEPLNEYVETKTIKVSMEEANQYLDMKSRGSRIVGNATSLCILRPCTSYSIRYNDRRSYTCRFWFSISSYASRNSCLSICELWIA